MWLSDYVRILAGMGVHDRGPLPGTPCSLSGTKETANL